jgi:hypothetical protein
MQFFIEYIDNEKIEEDDGADDDVCTLYMSNYYIYIF